MDKLLRRTFEVTADVDAAWRRLADVPSWPTWARHLRRVRMSTPSLDATTTATLVLRNGTRARVSVTDIEPGRRFRWEGTFLWLKLGYDHVVESGEDGGARITFVVEGSGLLAGSVGRILASLYARDLDRAIPRLQGQLDGRPHSDRS